MAKRISKRSGLESGSGPGSPIALLDGPGAGGPTSSLPPGTTRCPFTISIDTREQLPYEFANLRTNKDQGSKQIIVPTRRDTLTVGDYSIFGLPMIVIERKSKEDLFNSVAKRDNFESRLRRMCLDHSAAFVMVEAETKSLLNDPPPRSQLHPKSLIRSIDAWMIRWPRVHWVFMWDRASAEARTFRILEGFYNQWKKRATFDQQIYDAGIDRGGVSRFEAVEEDGIGDGGGLGPGLEGAVSIRPKAGETWGSVRESAEVSGEGEARRDLSGELMTDLPGDSPADSPPYESGVVNVSTLDLGPGGGVS